MNIEEVRFYCLSKEKTEESFPFDNETLVFKVNNKIYALLSLSGYARLSLKCNPEKAIELREYYPEISPGYHMNKQHWNTIDLNGNLNNALIKSLIDHSYDLIKPNSFLKKKKRT
ncbi:MAG: MmcQ/YjbR family DNA-binding protein [Bacteroidales bacterium]|jgi:predicted DNA-binding protein (MmcQ/YjbR family)|nr:MmcQ/YjbR family DNA-binding protein [Bacteroidales bacterium]